MKHKILILVLCLFTFNFSYTQNEKHLKSINEQVWEPFTKAFETFDYELFGSIHRTDLVRISGDGKRIKAFPDYIDGYKKRWQNKKGEQTISFRFFERITTDELASERGIYKLTVNLNTAEQKSYYGQFHVLLKNTNGQWKLIMDYDSSEKSSINEASYAAAFSIDDFEKY